MFPACGDGSDADSAVTSVVVAHKHIREGLSSLEKGSSVSKKSSLFFLLLPKIRKKTE